MSIFHILLEMVWMRSHPISLHRVVRSLGAAAAACGEAIDTASKSGDDEHLDFVIDQECGVIENLIGAAFVTCQAEITAVVSPVMRLHTEAKTFGHVLKSSDGTKQGILAIGSPCVGQTQHTEVQVINAFANYFKHNDEWNASWQQLPAREKQKVAVITAIGAKEYSTGNLRQGAESLGVKNDELYLLGKCIENWSSAVYSAYHKELKQLQLL